MSAIIIAAIIIAGIGLVGGILLVAASKAFAVTEDEKIKQIELVLPGANCGGCGYAGCSSYAKAIIDGAPINQCSVGGSTAAEKISVIVGRKAGQSTPYKAIVACLGDKDHTRKRYQYYGLQTCSACNMLYSGDLSCPYGCLGYGDCVRACKFGAISIVNGVSVVDPEKCTGCGTCRTVCPKKAIFMYNASKKGVRVPVVMCSNHKKGADTRRDCTAGCIGCGKCVKNCPMGAIEVRNNVARIEFSKCVGCRKCIDNCPVHCIRLPEITASASARTSETQA